MANRKLTPAKIVGDSLGPMLPESRAELAEGMALVRMSESEADAQFGDGEAYALERCLQIVDINTTILERATLQIGRYFCWMKEREPHGSFEQAIETRTKYSVRSAQVFMGLSRALLTPAGTPIPLVQYLMDSGGALSKSKLIELSHLHPDELAKLGAGEEVKGLTREKIKVMTAREMAQELAAKDIENESVRERNEKLVAENESLDKEIKRMRRGGIEFEEHSYLETIKEARALAEKALIGFVDSLAVLQDAQKKLGDIEVPKHLDDVAKRAPVMTLNAGTLQIAESLARVLWEQEALFAKYINDAPRTLAAINAQD